MRPYQLDDQAYKQDQSALLMIQYSIFLLLFKPNMNLFTEVRSQSQPRLRRHMSNQFRSACHQQTLQTEVPTSKAKTERC